DFARPILPRRRRRILIQLPGILDRAVSLFKPHAQARSEIAQIAFERFKVELPSRRFLLHRVNNEVSFESALSSLVLILSDLVCAFRAKHCESLLVRRFRSHYHGARPLVPAGEGRSLLRLLLPVTGADDGLDVAARVEIALDVEFQRVSRRDE